MKRISYCIPVMDRTDDIKQTLEHNLSIVRCYSSDAEIIINCFDEDDSLSSWVTTHFAADIQSGVLRFNKLKPLPYWHFCWAKNSFKLCVQSRYYASLDGDNYLSETEVATTIKLCKETSNSYLFHLFSGTWGDGTSGRIIVLREHYLTYGYCDEFFPRQFDELALILAVLSNEDVVFVSRTGVNLFELSGLAKSFNQKSLFGQVTHKECDFGEVIAPMLPRGAGYVVKDEKLQFFQNINAFYWLTLIAKNSKARYEYRQKLEEQQKLILQLDNRKS